MATTQREMCVGHPLTRTVLNTCSVIQKVRNFISGRQNVSIRTISPFFSLITKTTATAF